MNTFVFSILITTKNRIEDLKITLKSISELLELNSLECIICDDGSTDGTYDYIKSNYPDITVFKHVVSKGLISSRNELLSKTTAKYAISLDDDANFLTDNVLEAIASFFEYNKKCAVIAFRIFWDKNRPLELTTVQKSKQVNSYVGCGHVWRMEAWKSIPDYLEWFDFYGEEQFAALQLAKTDWEIHYLPSVLVHHRVDMKTRRNQKDYLLRQRQSLRSGWYLYFLCFPVHLALKFFISSLLSQIKRKVLKGNRQASKAILLALKDVTMNITKFFSKKYRLSIKEYNDFSKLPAAPIYWKKEIDEEG